MTDPDRSWLPTGPYVVSQEHTLYLFDALCRIGMRRNTCWAGAWFFFASCVIASNVPTFTYSLPGVQINGIAEDASGNTYIAGTTVSATIPTTPGAFQTRSKVASMCGIVFSIPVFCNDSFVIKLDPNGKVVLATYLGGNGDTSAQSIAVDRQGNIYVAGTTSPPGGGKNEFPVTPGAAFPDPGTDPSTSRSGFIAKLNPFGSQLVYGTFLPGTFISALALDPDENVYVTGTGSPLSFPATSGAFQVSPKGGSTPPGVVAKLNASGSALVYATYLSGSGVPGSGGDNPDSIAVDAVGNAFVAGWTRSSDFPVTPGAFQTHIPAGTERNGFVTELNQYGNALIYSTFLGPTNGYGIAIRLDDNGTAFVAGATNSTTFPTTEGAMPVSGGPATGFLTRISADGSSLIYSTFLPTFNFPTATLDVDKAGNAVIAGATGNPRLEVGVGAFQSQYAGGASDIYIAKFTPEGKITASTYLGGAQDDYASALAFGPNGSISVGSSSVITNIFPSLTAINSASYVAAVPAPGELVSLLGYGIGPDVGMSANGSRLPTELAGVQVYIGGTLAPLLYVQSHVINVQVPWELEGITDTSLRVIYSGLPAMDVPLRLAASSPGIFGVRNSTGTLNTPSNSAKPGDFITIYGTGGGPTNPPAATGAFWADTMPLPLLTLDTSVTVDGEKANVLYAGASPQSSTGIFQINVVVPSDLNRPSAAAELRLSIGNVPTVIPIAIGN